MEGSILESIGVEIIGVMSPVSICMFLVVLLVYSLSSPTPVSTPIRTAANLVYLETPSDSTTQKLEGALLNAAVFVVLIAVVTFILVLLYYYNFTNFLKNYMRFSAFFVLGSMGGGIFLSIIQHFSIPVDSITCFMLLFNFTILGVLSVFSRGIPIFLRQGYMVLLGIIVATWFTKLPEWTTWVLLVALAVYDLVAVLAPGGPLKILVELASSRDEELPALVYEARPTVARDQQGRGSLGVLVAGAFMASPSIELQNVGRNLENDSNAYRSSIQTEAYNGGEDEERIPLVSPSSTVVDVGSLGARQSEIVEERSSHVMGHEAERSRRDIGGGGGDSGRDLDIIMKPGIKLGLGDFVFYSVLVGRAAMYDLMTVYACYLAIISGLGCTLILLSVCHRALPALPISITLGVTFYFLTRLLMEPFVVGTSTNLLMF
ncbi:hypothetical protein IFM89_013270 [Coptis chinensis]|uniref:Presenilin n=1 Tax=Coptis chinensis TaxID=261450 RepID=A0A835M911_9MAGN|nr:hypothetical protein IFM89_007796 [Coptis chinensis]KAF9624732.1 hypothetical protein IFM89_013270 [Coptis chinensis]